MQKTIKKQIKTKVATTLVAKKKSEEVCKNNL